MSGLGLATFAMLVTVAPSSVRADPPAQEPRPSVVLLIADDLGFGDIGVYGSASISTPRIDEIAADGAKFESFYVHPSCSPSRAALLTGRYALRVGITSPLGAWSPVGLDPAETTLAEVLSEEGYRTGYFGKWHVGDAPEQQPPAQGFDEFVGLLWGPTGIPIVRVDSRDGTETFDPDLRFDTRVTTERSLDFLAAAANEEDPFLLVVAYTTPHEPASASPEFLGTSADARDYGDAVEEMDASVGEIVDAIDAYGLGESTLVLFFSDNGAATLGQPYQRGSNGILSGGKGSTWEGGVRVPAVVRWSGAIPAGLSIVDPVSVTDILPTVAALVGTPLDPTIPLDGLDLSELLSGAPGPPGRFVHLIRGQAVEAVRRGPFKLRFGELFDVEQDPGETVDIAGQFPVEVAELSAELDALRADLAVASAGPAPSSRVIERWRAGSGHPPELEDGVEWNPVTPSGAAFVLADQDPDLDLEVVDVAALGNSTLPPRAHRLPEPSADVRWFRDGAPIDESGPFSIAFWYRAALDDPDEALCVLDVGDGAAGLSVTIGDGGELGDDREPGRKDDLLVRIGGAVSPTSGAVVVDLPGDTSASFVHVTLVRRATGDLVVYLDGFAVAEVFAPGARIGSDGRWALFAPDGALGGASGPGVLPFDATRSAGEIAGFGAWARALQLPEIEAQYCRYSAYAYCSGGENTVGTSARLALRGSFHVPDRRLFAQITEANPSTVGILLASRHQWRIPVSRGFVCLGDPIFRIAENLFVTDAEGEARMQLTWDFPPAGFDIGSAIGWNFQCWYRDGSSSNFTNGISVIFCP